MASPAAAPRIVEELTGAFAGARAVLSNVLDLFTLEARRAGLTLALMLACAALGVIFVVAAWLGLMAALALWAIGIGFSWEATLGFAALANLAIAAALYGVCARLSRDLLFPATRRQLLPVRRGA